MATTQITGSFTLPDEKVTVKFIPKKKGMAANVPDNHVISGGMINNAIRKFSAPLQANGKVANILTTKEKALLESVTGLKLSVYGDFWQTFMVRLFKEDTNNIFDLNDPMDYISIRLLESLPVIANSWKERNNDPRYQYVITRDSEISNEKKSRLDVKKEAFKAYGRIEDDREKLLSILKLISSSPISKDSKLDWIQGKVEEYLDNKPKQFLDIVKDENFDIKVLISKAVDAGIIINKSKKYSTIDGLELAENGEIPSYTNAVRYLSNPKHQEVLLLIQARVENNS